MTLEAELEKLIQPRLAAAWEAGCYAGQVYGQAHERFDPNRDPEYDEPTPPQNPFRVPDRRG